MQEIPNPQIIIVFRIYLKTQRIITYLSVNQFALDFEVLSIRSPTWKVTNEVVLLIAVFLGSNERPIWARVAHYSVEFSSLYLLSKLGNILIVYKYKKLKT